MVNEKLCPCCGQIRPYPTEPGIWEYCEYPTTTKQYWNRVEIKKTDDGLVIIKDGEEVWWPDMAMWRKV